MPRTGESFEFFDDNHWNGLGHGVAAEAVLESKLLARLRSNKAKTHPQAGQSQPVRRGCGVG